MDDNPRIAALATQIYDEAWKANRLEINGKKLSDDIYLCKMFCEGSHFLRRNFLKKFHIYQINMDMKDCLHH